MVTISLCMIVRDESAVLAQCLDSVKDAVDEIILVDTGSVDHTKEIAGKYTKKVYDFPWQEDFSLARNFSFSKAEMDYCMWLDADDFLPPKEREQLISWKKQADKTADVVLMKYAAGFDEQGRAVFSYYRERLLKRERGFVWKGRVHEAIAVSGRLEYLDLCIEHHSQKKVYGTRNLNIYEKMKQEGLSFSARDIFYYARELYYHQYYPEAVQEFRSFLKQKGGFSENQVEACRLAAYCCYALGKEQEALAFLCRGLGYCVPKGELCCDLGKHYMDRGLWDQAVFWFETALQVPKQEMAGGFVQEECYGYLPCVQLSVCYTQMGERGRALQYHRQAGAYKPYGVEFQKNEAYFQRWEKEYHGN